jgi:hypothetical protein
VLYAYVFIPLVDELIWKKDAHNIQKEAFQEIIDDWYFDVLVYLDSVRTYRLGLLYVLTFDNLFGRLIIDDGSRFPRL